MLATIASDFRAARGFQRPQVQHGRVEIPASRSPLEHGIGQPLHRLRPIARTTRSIDPAEGRAGAAAAPPGRAPRSARPESSARGHTAGRPRPEHQDAVVGDQPAALVQGSRSARSLLPAPGRPLDQGAAPVAGRSGGRSVRHGGSFARPPVAGAAVRAVVGAGLRQLDR